MQEEDEDEDKDSSGGGRLALARPLPTRFSQPLLLRLKPDFNKKNAANLNDEATTAHCSLPFAHTHRSK